MMFPASGLLIVVVVLYLLSSIKILKEYERAVIFRLGRLLPQAKGPGRDFCLCAAGSDGARVAACGAVRSAAAGCGVAR